MEKIELKHLACYLPYGLKIMAKIESQIETHPFEHCDIVNVNLLSKSLTIRHMVGIDKDVEYITYKNFEDIKPILRPLSDLIKQDAIEHNYVSLDDLIRSIESEHCPIKVWTELLSEHFDVFSLLDKGLAIDINTLTNRHDR